MNAIELQQHNARVLDDPARVGSPPEYYDAVDSGTQFLDMDIGTQREMLIEYFRLHPQDVVDVSEYIAGVTDQQLLTVMLHGNPREVHTFHRQQFIEYFAPRVQRAIDKGEIE